MRPRLAAPPRPAVRRAQPSASTPAQAGLPRPRAWPERGSDRRHRHRRRIGRACARTGRHGRRRKRVYRRGLRSRGRPLGERYGHLVHRNRRQHDDDRHQFSRDRAKCRRHQPEHDRARQCGERRGADQRRRRQRRASCGRGWRRDWRPRRGDRLPRDGSRRRVQGVGARCPGIRLAGASDRQPLARQWPPGGCFRRARKRGRQGCQRLGSHQRGAWKWRRSER